MSIFDKDPAVVLITGTSSGFGLAASIELARRGARVFATMRNPDRDGALQEAAQRAGVSVEVIALDVTDDDSVNSAIATVIERAGKIDALVNNAGYGLVGAFEDMTEQQVRRQMETNFFGVLRTTRAVLPHMRQQGHGNIINITSVAGKMGSPMMTIYCASKFALEGFTETLQIETKPFGIRCSLIEPGPFATDFTTRSKDVAKAGPDSPYGPITQAYLDTMDNYPAFGNPKVVARRIAILALAERPRFRNLLGADVRILALVERIAGSEVRRRIMQGGFLTIARFLGRK